MIEIDATPRRRRGRIDPLTGQPYQPREVFCGICGVPGHMIPGHAAYLAARNTAARDDVSTEEFPRLSYNVAQGTRPYSLVDPLLNYQHRWRVHRMLVASRRSFSGVVRAHICRVLGLPWRAGNARRPTLHVPPELRPSLTTSEWRAIDEAAHAAGMPPQTWLHAACLGAFFQKVRWTPGEAALLTLVWQRVPTDTLRRWLPAHSVAAIYVHATTVLKLPTDPGPEWVPRFEVVRAIPRPRWLVLELCANLEMRYRMRPDNAPRKRPATRVFVRVVDAERVAAQALARRTVNDLAPIIGHCAHYIRAHLRAAGYGTPGRDMYATLEEACAVCGLSVPRSLACPG